MLNTKVMRTVIHEFERNETLLWLAGFFALFIGLFSVSLYGIWSADWRVLVTILGWLSVLKGFACMVFPRGTIGFYKRLKPETMMPISGGVAFILGLALLYFSWVG